MCLVVCRPWLKLNMEVEVGTSKFRHGRGTGGSRDGGTTRRMHGGGSRRPWRTSPNAVACTSCSTINLVPKLLPAGGSNPSCYWCGEAVCSSCLDARDKGYHICKCSRRLTECTRAPGGDWCQICGRNLPLDSSESNAMPRQKKTHIKKTMPVSKLTQRGAMMIKSAGTRGKAHAAVPTDDSIWIICPMEILTTVRACTALVYIYLG